MERSHNESKGVRPGLLLGTGIVAAALIAAKLLGVFGGTKSSDTPDVTAAPPESAPAARPPAPRPAPRPPTGEPPGLAALQPAVPVAMPADPTLPEWSAKLDDVLGSSEDEAQKAQRLLAMWPTLPEDGQIELMQHITNLLPDDKFQSLHNTFTNAQTHETVLDILMTDALNRPNGIKLPALLDVARTQGHPKAEEARDILEVFVDKNYGADWAKWEKAVQDWLKENPDDPPPDVK